MADELQFKSASIGSVYVDEDGTFEAKITSDAVDLDDEVLLPQGMNPSYFDSCGAWYWDHRYDLPPVAANRGVKQGRNYWTAKGQFAQRPEGYVGEYLPQLIQSLVEQRVIRGVSVGFSIQERRNPTPKDKATFGERVKSIVSKWSLREISLTAMPCNPEALLSAVKNSGASLDFAKSYFKLPDVIEQPTEIVVPVTKKIVLCVGHQEPPVETPVDVKGLVAEAVKREMAKLRGRVFY